MTNLYDVLAEFLVSLCSIFDTVCTCGLVLVQLSKEAVKRAMRLVETLNMIHIFHVDSDTKQTCFCNGGIKKTC